MNELLAAARDIKRIAGPGTLAKLGVIDSVGRGSVSVRINESAVLPHVVVPYQIDQDLIEVDKRALCLYAGGQWILQATLTQPDRYSRDVLSAAETDAWTLFGPAIDPMKFIQGAFVDHFMGVVFDPRWALRTSGTGAANALVTAVHGGAARLTCGTTDDGYARLQLGDWTSGGYLTDSLSTDPGFCIIAQLKISAITNVLVDMFVNSSGAVAPRENLIHVTGDTDRSGNWWLRTDWEEEAYSNQWADSGVAFDTTWHTHVLEVKPGIAYHWIDKVLVNSSEARIPLGTHPMTMSIRCLARAASASKYVTLDYVAAVPN